MDKVHKAMDERTVCTPNNMKYILSIIENALVSDPDNEELIDLRYSYNKAYNYAKELENYDRGFICFVYGMSFLTLGSFYMLLKTIWYIL
jgi:hypothetical protein